MFKILLWTLVLDGMVARYGADQPPPETILPTDSIKPRVSLSLLSPDSPHEGDDVLLQCSAKPKNSSKSTQPDNVHWIKGNVGVPEPGHKPEAVRYVREKSKDDDGSILFKLTIKEIEVTDADKYMCIVQVGETGYFTSNEIQVDVEPGDPEVRKKKVESKKQKEEQDLEEILSWKDRLSDLSPDELKIYANAYLENEQRMEAQKKAEDEEKERQAKKKEEKSREKSESKTTTDDATDVEELTDDEKGLLERRGDIGDMSELELYQLSQALKKEKRIKEMEKRKKRESKEEKEKRWRKALKKQEEEEARKAEEKKIAEEKRKQAEELFKLTPEEEAILKRQDELADFTGKEIKLLHKALAKQRNIDGRQPLFEKETKQEEEKKEDDEEDEFAEPELTEEEKEIFARKDEIRDMTQEELKIMASAVTKQKKIQEVRRKKYNVQWPDEDEQGKEEKKPENVKKPAAKLEDQAKEPIMAEELLMLLKQDHVMDLTNDELPFLARGLKKLQYLEDSDPNVADDMSTDDMFDILAKKDKILDMEQDELDMYLLAMVKEKKIKFGRKEQPKKKPQKLSDEKDKPFTNEEVAMLLRRNDVANLEHDELPILARALTKQDYRDKDDPTLGDDMSDAKMTKILAAGKDEIMAMNQKDLDLYIVALIRQQKNKIKPRKKPEDEMTVAEMNRILKWQDERDVSDLSQEELSQLGTALLKQKKMKEAKSNDPLEGEHDEL